VIVAERPEPSKHRVDLGLLETNAASASSCDLAIWLRILALIFGLRIGDFDDPMNASAGDESKQNSRSQSDV
jgi:hypothetical protein